jgi:hypothetical protein
VAPPGNQAANGENKYQPEYWEKPVYSTQYYGEADDDENDEE